MQQTSTDAVYDEPPTTLGPAPDSSDETVTLPDGALSKGCYVKGDSTRSQTSLLQSCCVEWAEAGHGFCYFHPTGPAPIELLERLPADRLDDVVWIDFDRAPYADYDITADHRVQIDPYDVPEPAVMEEGFDPVGLRTNAVLEMAREQTDWYNWNVARIISAVLPSVLRDTITPGCDDFDDLDELARSLFKLRRYEDMPMAMARLGLEIDGPTARQLRAAILHSEWDVYNARRLLTNHRDGQPGYPVGGPTTYDVGRAIEDDHIVLVTAGIPHGRVCNSRRPVKLGARLYVAAICCRLVAAAQSPDDVRRAFPVVVDGVREFMADDGALLAALLEHADQTPLAPVFGGPPLSFLSHRFANVVSKHTANEVTVPDPDVPIDPEGLLMLAFKADPGRPDYWDNPTAQVDPRVNTAPSERPRGFLATMPQFSSEDRPDAHAYQPSPPPEVRHDEATVTGAIDRSLQRHGTDLD